MSSGEIYFVKADEQIKEMLPVQDGKFSGKASPGSRKVEIYSYKEVPPSEEIKKMYGADAKGSKENFVPAKFNTESTLTADIKAGMAPLSFDVTSK